MKIIQQKTLYRMERFHSAFPSITKLNSGNLILAFRRARDGMWLIPEDKRGEMDTFARMDHIDSRSHILLLELSADGETEISQDILPCDPEAADQDPSLMVLANGDVLLASFSWYPLPSDATTLMASRKAPDDDEVMGCRYIYWGSHLSIRTANTQAWRQHHQYLPATESFGQTYSTNPSKSIAPAIRGQGLLGGNEVFFAAYGSKQEGCVLFNVKPDDLTARFQSLIARDDEQKVAFLEPALCGYGMGEMVCFMRTAGADDKLATCHTNDGHSWSQPKLHQLAGHPFHPLLLQDGRVLLTYGYRHKPYGIRARLLHDIRQDPDESPEWIIRDDGLCKDIGYPWAVELPDGRILVCYYWTDSDGIRSIQGSWLEID